MTTNIKYSYTRPREFRKHYIDADDVRVLLERLPEWTWSRLRAVHFNDESLGVRRLGYVDHGRREIAICALPPNVSLARHVVRSSPRQFGAVRGMQWPERAARRFMLYDVLLRELGYLQVIDPKARSARRKFASRTKAREFAYRWRARLWSKPFEHPDPIHNRPTELELELLEYESRSQADPRPVSLVHF